MIIESDSESRLSEIMQNGFPEVEYIFVEDHNPMLYRTHLMNEEFRRVRTRNAANIDVDIIVPIEQSPPGSRCGVKRAIRHVHAL